jgi:mRNA interferase YafQ
MRKIEFTKKFKKDFRRIKAGQHGPAIDELLDSAVMPLAADEMLPPRWRDHALSGEWTDHRECHLRPGLLLIYRKPDFETLQLVLLGSYSDLGL